MYDLSGKKFGKLTVLQRLRKNNKSGWICLCECGNKVFSTTNRLLTGHSKSCGCLKRNTIIFDKTDKRIYNIWKKMKDRCFIKNSKSYCNYGGRGITICEEWKASFESFRDWALNNGYSCDLTLDRINVNGNYEPSNCRWATRRQQATNKRNCHYLNYNGETKTLTEWAEECGIPTNTLKSKLKKGLTLKEIIKNKNLFLIKIFNDNFELQLNITNSQMEILKIICKNNGLNLLKI